MVITQSPFEGTAVIVVLDSIPNERRNFAIVTFDGDLNLHLTLGSQQQLPHIGGQPHLIGSQIEIPLSAFETTHCPSFTN